MGIKKLFRFYRDETLHKAVASLCTDIAALREETAQIASSVSNLDEQQKELVSVKGDISYLSNVTRAGLDQATAVRGMIDDMEERLSDIALAHLTQTGELGDTTIATLAEVSRLRQALGLKDLADHTDAIGFIVQGHDVSRIEPEDPDALELTMEERQSLLILSSFFKNLVN